MKACREWNPVWMTVREFENARPLCMYHRENDREAEAAVKEAGSGIRNLHILLRADVELGSVKGAKLRISADDYCVLSINGEPAFRGPAPAYPEKYYYSEIPAGQFLRAGQNRLACHLYYQGLINRVWNSADNRCAIACEIETADGQTVPVSWHYKISDAFSGDVTGYDTQFLENFDASKWDYGWETGDIDGSFLPAVRAEWADYHLTLQPTPQPEQYDVLPDKVTVRDGRVFADFGREYCGRLYIKVSCSAPEPVTVRCGEELNADGTVRYDMRCNCRYEERFLPIPGVSSYENYDSKAFRYTELLLPEGTELKELKLKAQNYPLDENCISIQCGDERISRIFELCRHTVRIGTQEGFLDCPTREKGQYLGDAIISARCHTLLTGNTALLEKCIDQFAQTAAVTPSLLAVAPGSLMQEIADFSLLWSELLIFHYGQTGDRDFLERYYPTAKGIIEDFRQYERADGLLENVRDKWNLVDWPENLRDGYDFPLTRPVKDGCHNVINALYIGSMLNLRKIEEILGIAGSYDIKCKVTAFYRAFFRPEQGLFADSDVSSHISLHSNIYPLYFGFSRFSDDGGTGYEKKAADLIMTKGLCCGSFAAYFVLKALTRCGRAADAYSLIVNESENGWMNMLREGATTAFESWGRGRKWNTSLCHPWSCSPAIIILEDLAGPEFGIRAVRGKN